MATAIRREDEGALKKTETATSCEAESGEDSDYEMGMTFHELCEHNAKHIDRHHRKVIESEGFDADVVVEDELGDCVGPRRFTRRVLNRRMDEMKSCCELAIEEYNTNNATNLKLVRVVKANFEPAGVGERYFITFQAAEDSSGAANYQAKLYAPYKFTGMKATVDFCRPEPLR